MEELLYEFFDRIEREKAAQELTEQQSDNIEQAKEQDALDWAEQEEKREQEALERREGGSVKLSPPSDEEVAANKKWMAEQLAEQKKLLGEDFGEDMNFSMDK